MAEFGVPRTRALWVVLAVLLLFGTVASAFVVFGVTDLWATGRWWWDVPAMLAGGFVAVVLLLLIGGILYRVDRIRGVAQRTVRMFD